MFLISDIINYIFIALGLLIFMLVILFLATELLLLILEVIFKFRNRYEILIKKYFDVTYHYKGGRSLSLKAKFSKKH